MKRAHAHAHAAKRRRLLASLAVVFGVVGVVAACSNQGEGERCNFLNGDEDCKTDEGLSCYPKAQLTGTDSDRCCPTDRSKATHPVCVTPISIVGVDAETPADTGPSPTTPTADATVNDAAKASDAKSDAADASDGGG